jgi:hypothetical protein
MERPISGALFHTTGDNRILHSTTDYCGYGILVKGKRSLYKKMGGIIAAQPLEGGEGEILL